MALALALALALSRRRYAAAGKVREARGGWRVRQPQRDDMQVFQTGCIISLVAQSSSHAPGVADGARGVEL